MKFEFRCSARTFSTPHDVSLPTAKLGKGGACDRPDIDITAGVTIGDSILIPTTLDGNSIVTRPNIAILDEDVAAGTYNF